MNKKVTVILAVMIIAAMLLVSCTTNTPETPDVKPSESVSPDPSETPEPPSETEKLTLSEILEAIYRIKQPEMILGETVIDLENADQVNYFTGLADYSNVKEILASETMIGSQAYSLVLLQLDKAAGAKDTAQAIYDNVDQRKWICVGADDMTVVVKDDVVMLFMVDSVYSDSITAAQMSEAFSQVMGGLDAELKK